MITKDKLGVGGLGSKIKWVLAPYPDLFNPLYRLLSPPSHRKLLIAPDTELVIEGFPRCANTFAVVAFEMAQDRAVKIAHHLHSESQIIAGVRRSLPVVALIRSPMEAVRSFHARHSDVDPTWALARYIAFYRAVDILSDRLVIADFKDVSQNYARIIQRVNTKFRTSFSLFEHTESNVKRVFQQIDSLNDAIDGGKETHAARPSATRARLYKTTTLNVPPGLEEQAFDLYFRLSQSR